MRIVECGSTLGYMAWYHRYLFVVTSDDKEGLHWFLCAFDYCFRLERFIIWLTHDPSASTAPWDSKWTVGLVVFRAYTSET